MTWSDLTQASTLSFSFNNVGLNLGQFLSNLVGPIVHQIQQYTQPIQSLINFLNTPIPGVDQLPGLGSFSLMTLLTDLGDSSGFGSVAHMLTTVSTLISDINSLSIGPNVSLPLGSFAFTGTQIAGPGAAADAADLTSALSLAGEFAAEQHHNLGSDRRGPKRHQFVQSQQRGRAPGPERQRHAGDQ